MAFWASLPSTAGCPEVSTPCVGRSWSSLGLVKAVALELCTAPQQFFFPRGRLCSVCCGWCLVRHARAPDTDFWSFFSVHFPFICYLDPQIGVNSGTPNSAPFLFSQARPLLSRFPFPALQFRTCLQVESSWYYRAHPVWFLSHSNYSSLLSVYQQLKMVI